MGADVSILASPALAGREAGSPGADSAAEFLAERYRRLGLRSAFGLRCDAAPGITSTITRRRTSRLASILPALIAWSMSRSSSFVEWPIASVKAQPPDGRPRCIVYDAW